MKKFLGLLISSIAIISLVSCKNPKQSSGSKDDEASSIIPISYSEIDHSASLETYYHVTFVNYDDSVLYEVDVLKGETAEYKGETPVKPEDDEFTYEFDGWDKELTNIQSEVVAVAQYKFVAKENWSPIIWF